MYTFTNLFEDAHGSLEFKLSSRAYMFMLTVGGVTSIKLSFPAGLDLKSSSREVTMSRPTVLLMANGTPHDFLLCNVLFGPLEDDTQR